jgi:hypothetical protein
MAGTPHDGMPAGTFFGLEKCRVAPVARRALVCTWSRLGAMVGSDVPVEFAVFVGMKIFYALKGGI